MSGCETPKTEIITPKNEEPKTITPVVTPKEPEIVKNKSGKLVFVFDDAGHNMRQLTPFLNLPFPCTIAVLPSLTTSGEAANALRKSGKELILHQPMQPVNLSEAPGRSSIQHGMYSYQAFNARPPR